ncbi:Hypothetical protein PHPALM_6617, partial [Phytophthora palmivora]
RKLVGNDSNRGPSGSAKKDSEQLQEEITVAYCKDIPSLFLLYQADSDKLVLLLQLIPMLTLKSEVIGHHSSRIKELLEKLKHAYLLHSDEELLMSLSLSITHLLQTEHTSLKREAEVIMHDLAQDVMDKIDHLLEADIKLHATLAISREDKPKSKSRKARGRKSKNLKTKEIADVEYDLRIALCRLKCLMKYLNIREYLPPDLRSGMDADNHSTGLDTQQRRMNNLVAAVGDLLQRHTQSVVELDEGFRHADTIKHGLAIIYSDLLWVTAPIFKTVEEDKKRDSSSGTTSEATDTELDRSVQIQIQNVAHKVTDEEHKENEETPDPQPMESMEAIQFEDDDLASYDAKPPYNALEWVLPKVLISLTQQHFEREMYDAEEEPEFEDNMIGDDIAIANEKSILEWQEKQQRKAELLVALGRVSLCNPSNKRQAVAVLEYFTSRDKATVEVVKAFGKQVKADAPVRYLEIQMIALRQLFNPILVWKRDFEAAETNVGNIGDAEQEELKERMENRIQELKELAKRFSIRYGLEQPNQFEFLETMRVYLSHLDYSSMTQLREYFMERLKLQKASLNWYYVFASAKK